MKLLSCLLCALALAGCSLREESSPVTREDLFSLGIGRLEDQIALYNLQGDRGRRRADMAMRDGFFYISDGPGEKIVRFSSYGELLFMIYNEETNPLPLSLKPLEAGSLVTRWAVSYPLREPGEIAADSRRHIYVRDILPPERRSYAGELRALLDGVILHFDSDGRFLNYLGQEGIGGTPFPRIEGLYTSLQDEVAVVCHIPSGWNIYWFDAEGVLLYLIRIPGGALPVPPDWPAVIPSLDAVAAAPDERKIYLKVDYYRDVFDESTNTRVGNEADSSVIWIMNVEDGSWADTLEIPLYDYSYTENNRRLSQRLFYSLLGVIRNGGLFFSVPVDGGYSLLFAGSGGTKFRRGFIRVDDGELLFNAFDLSGDGILSAMLADEWRVKLARWRTDKLAGEGGL